MCVLPVPDGSRGNTVENISVKRTLTLYTDTTYTATNTDIHAHIHTMILPQIQREIFCRRRGTCACPRLVLWFRINVNGSGISPLIIKITEATPRPLNIRDLGGFFIGGCWIESVGVHKRVTLQRGEKWQHADCTRRRHLLDVNLHPIMYGACQVTFQQHRRNSPKVGPLPCSQTRRGDQR